MWEKRIMNPETLVNIIFRNIFEDFFSAKICQEPKFRQEIALSFFFQTNSSTENPERAQSNSNSNSKRRKTSKRTGTPPRNR